MIQVYIPKFDKKSLIKDFILGKIIFKFDKKLVLIWLFMSLIIGNAFKGLLRNQIINQPKWWFHSIEELINAPTDYEIYVTDDLTYYSIKKRSNYDPNFKKLLNRLKPLTVLDFFGFSLGSKFYYRKCAGFTTSIKWELQKAIGGNEVVIDEIRYDHMLDVRFIRKDFPFANQMVQL